MSRLVLTSATTKTDVSAFVNNDNVDALLATVNGGLDGTYNIASGGVAASGKSDLNSHLAGNGLSLASNQLSVGSSLTASNFSASAGILGSQIASNSLASLAANAQSNLLNLLVSSTNAASQLKMVRGAFYINAGLNGITTQGEGFTAVYSGTSGYGTATITFSSSFGATPIVVASYIQINTAFSVASNPLYVTSVSASQCVINLLFESNLAVGAGFIVLGT